LDGLVHLSYITDVVCRATAGLLLASALLAGNSRAAKVPEWRSVAATSLGLRFHLTSDWGVETRAGVHTGWRWEAYSPGQIAWMHITAARSALTLDQLAMTAVANIRSSTAGSVSADPSGTFKSSRTSVAGVPAVRVYVRGMQATPWGPREAAMVEVTFVHAGVAYLIQFDSQEKFAPRFLPTLERAIATMRLTQVA
jgi:hypothetical protein